MSMNVRVKLFAAARQLAGRDEISLQLDQGASVAQLRETLISSHPELEPIVAHLLFAVNQQYADESTVIEPNAEIAVIPPVSGG